MKLIKNLVVVFLLVISILLFSQEGVYSVELSSSRYDCVKVVLTSGDVLGGYSYGADASGDLVLEVEDGVVKVGANDVNSIEVFPFNDSGFDDFLYECRYRSVDSIRLDLEQVSILADYFAGEYDKYPLSIVWNGEIARAKQLARLLGKRILIKFHLLNDAASKRLDRDIFSDKSVQELVLPNFVVAEIIGDYARDFALENFGVEQYPYFVFIDADGNSITSINGNITSSELKDLASRVIAGEVFPEHTRFVKKELVEAEVDEMDGLGEIDSGNVPRKRQKSVPKTLSILMRLSWISFFALFIGVFVFVIVITEMAKKKQKESGDNKFVKNLSMQQNIARNAGWRIQYISWQGDKLEFVPNTTLTTFMGLGGFCGFLIGAMLLVFERIPTGIALIFMVVSFLTMLASRFVMASVLYKDWIKIDALCIDEDIQVFKERVSTSEGRTRIADVWKVRVLCEFYYNGRDYTVTPEIPRTSGFSTKTSAEKYLSKLIRVDKHCALWIDPKNSLHTVLHRKPFIAI